MILNRLQKLRDRMDLAKRRKSYRKKVGKILEAAGDRKVDFDARDIAIRKWLPDYRITDWHIAYASFNGIVSPHYLPEDVFYTWLEPKINNRENLAIYSNKVSLGFLLGEENYIGFDYFVSKGHYHGKDGAVVEFAELEDWIRSRDEVVFKPYEISGGGRGVEFLSGDEAVAYAASLDHGVIIQQVFVQHPTIAELQPSSVNTMRVTTLRMNGAIHIVSTAIRMGGGKNRMDNATQGGVFTGVDKQGRLRNVGYDLNYDQYDAHPTSGVALGNRQLPSWPEIGKLVARCHNLLLGMDLVSWDVSVGVDGVPKIVEVNVRNQDINGHQVLNGPVFEPFLEYLFTR